MTCNKYEAALFIDGFRVFRITYSRECDVRYLPSYYPKQVLQHIYGIDHDSLVLKSFY